jgi:hypothetical protein
VEAAVAFGCNPRTMHAHYIAMDELATADSVLHAIAKSLDPRVGANGPTTGAATDSEAAAQGAGTARGRVPFHRARGPGNRAIERGVSVGRW